MLIPIEINQQDILDNFNISKKEVEDIMDLAIKNVTAAFAIEWENKALQSLSSTRSRYVANLKVVDEGRLSGAVILDYSKDKLVKMLEEGASAFDMKEYFKKSDKAKQKKNGSGWYLTVPFSIGTPGSLQENFTTVMPQQIYSIVKKQDVDPISLRSKGVSKGEIPSELNQKRVRPGFTAISLPKSKLFEEYQHKNSIYEGISKQTSPITGQTTYSSFRRVSDKSDSNSWTHPGIDAGNFAEKAFEQFEMKMQVVLEDSMNDALKYFGLE